MMSGRSANILAYLYSEKVTELRSGDGHSALCKLIERCTANEISSFHVDKQKVCPEEIGVKQWLWDVSDGKGPLEAAGLKVDQGSCSFRKF